MKRTFTIALIATFYFCSMFAQEPQQAPLNEDFIKFMEDKKKNKGNSIIPAPTTYVFSKEVSDKISKLSFPSSYDLRTEGLVSYVKNQGNAGHCWSFSAIGAVESRSMKLGFGELNLSEHNMATCHGFEWDEGGNQGMATAYYSRLSGPLNEPQDPYSDTDFSCSATGLTPQFYVTESIFLPRDPDVIKYYLMNYGGITVSYYADNQYFNSGNNTYYYSGNEKTDHSVLLVGWDNSKVTSGGTGAWIIKNSWGNSWGDNGYFYMSYNDIHALKSATIYPIRKELNTIDTLLMIDKFGEINSYGFGDYNDYGLIKYNVSEEHYFTQIGTYIGATNSIIDIEIFGTKTGDVLTDTLAKAYGIFAEYPGYSTFDVPFTANGDFYIKIEYYTPGDKYPIPVEKVITDYALPAIKSGVCWFSDEGDKWTALGSDTDRKIDLCIRAYGTKEDLKASFTSDRRTICDDSDVTFTSNSIGTITSYQWDFGEEATPATASTEGPHTVTYASLGFKTIKLVVEDGVNKDSLENYEYINVVNEINLSLFDEINLRINDTTEIYVNGGDTYTWSPVDSIIGSNTSSSIKISPDASMTYYVTGSMGSCSYTDSVKVTVIEGPDNDNVCDAITLTIDQQGGPFSNVAATVETNEPFPDTSGTNACTDPLHWCSEGGLQNSVWFKFVAPATKAVSITTSGFDNQIAVYDAETCDDIISGDDTKYTLIAANDDVDSQDFDAKIDKVEGLTVGKTYWLQMDGSAGGKEGQCTIKVAEEWQTGIENNLQVNDFIKAIPNPSSGDFRLNISKLEDGYENMNIKVIAMDGSVIYSCNGEINKSEYNITIDRKGIFIVRVVTENNQYSLPIIVK